MRTLPSKSAQSTCKSRTPSPVRPLLETLEGRITPAGTGNAWPNAQVVSISLIPDGVPMNANQQGTVYSNMFAKLNSRFSSPSVWQNIILKAAQTWAVQTNINFTLIADSGVAYAEGDYQQGDPTQGDIRFGGDDFGDNTILGKSTQPPPVNNFAIAGQVEINSALGWTNNGMSYDLFTIANHEFGHAIGLGHSSVMQASMFSQYNANKPNLNADDITSIRGVYNGARLSDAYDAAAANSTAATASNITSTIDASTLTAVLTGLDVTATIDVDYYKATAPVGSASSFTVKVQSAGLSLLSPKLMVYAADKTTLLGTVSGLNQYGTTLSLTINGVTAGQDYYIKVSGADTTVFSTGAYGMSLNFGTGANPTIPLPNTMLPNGFPIQMGGGMDLSDDHDGDNHGDSPAHPFRIAPSVIAHVNLPISASTSSHTGSSVHASVGVSKVASQLVHRPGHAGAEYKLNYLVTVSLSSATASKPVIVSLPITLFTAPGGKNVIGNNAQAFATAYVRLTKSLAKSDTSGLFARSAAPTVAHDLALALFTQHGSHNDFVAHVLGH